jgi:hypothetical protein
MPERLLFALETALSNFSTSLTKKREFAVANLSRIAESGDADHVRIAKDLLAKLKAGGELPSFGMFEVEVLAKALNSNPPNVKINNPKPQRPVENEEIDLVADENILVQI